mmetsp:Transcript_27003/g.80935  ORF Transcript_27003/g.80935 Transcript_27003/m.80935 type:complete len:259 (+) Transcript_27003:336-1112(+)
MRASCGISSPRGLGRSSHRRWWHATLCREHARSHRVRAAPSRGAGRQPIHSGSTPLCTAGQQGHSACLRLLLDANADVEGGGPGDSALFQASQEGHHECVEMLIGAGAAVDIASSDGTSALFMACQSGHTRSAELLLEGGASASLAGHEDGSTPLHAASEGGHLPCVLLLLAAGANPLQPMRGPARAVDAPRFRRPLRPPALRSRASRGCYQSCGGGVHGCDELVEPKADLGLGPLVRHWPLAHTGSISCPCDANHPY